MDTSSIESTLTGQKTIPVGTDVIPATVRAGTRARRFIRESSAQHHKIPLVYRETLRALISTFNSLKYITPDDEIRSIQCQHGNPERVVAKMREQNNIILPVLSITQTTSEDDVSRRRYEPTLVHEKYFDEDTQRAVRILSLAPKALNLSYNINIWAKYRSDMDQILEQIRLLFNPELMIPTKYSTGTKSYIVQEFDNTSDTAADKEDRILKRGITVAVQTYLPNPKFLITSSGKIERFMAETELYP